MKAVIIPADGSQVARIVDEKLDLKYMQGVVGGYIEAVDVDVILTDTGKKQTNATVFVNEEGKLIRLPVNPRATDLCAIAIGGWVRDVIAGDVIVVGQPDAEGETTPVPANIIKAVEDWGWL